ncbi:cytochrome P450 [Aspergillus homomorphus CBS 101889]|uniref:Cytochrome P450 n=1 Tax=Aspergillus homomorphus (strain CBS 101889) TaxID=1450537 RepID=A0A395HXW5_ASPHC|nr:cytochrome P450 [Aspergillus homomorphus CBS 101889]RAL12233.1 cytochrome P450 [Aspergillus homomorphus CBS 101889]
MPSESDTDHLAGKVVRLGPNTLSFDSATAMSDIYGVRANVRKADSYCAMGASRRSPTILTAIDKGLHGFKRRIMAQVFSEQSLKQIENRVLDNVTNFVSLLSTDADTNSGGTAPKNVADASTWLTFDIIADRCYGENINLLQSENMRWFSSAFRKISQRSMMNMMQPKLCQFKLDHIFLSSQYKDIRRAGSWIRERGEARARLGNDIVKKDIFSAMLNATHPKTGRSFTEKDLWVGSKLLLVAGSDTTSDALSATIYYLLYHQNSLARLTRELRTTFATEDSIRLDTASPTTSPYLHACINEALRLPPSVPNGPPRTVLPGRIPVDGDFIPEGTVIGTSIYTLHRNAAFFDQPDTFRPERWLDPSSPEQGSQLQLQLQLQRIPSSSSAASTTKQTQSV